jgi:hypothetical protein
MAKQNRSKVGIIPNHIPLLVSPKYFPRSFATAVLEKGSIPIEELSKRIGESEQNTLEYARECIEKRSYIGYLFGKYVNAEIAEGRDKCNLITFFLKLPRIETETVTVYPIFKMGDDVDSEGSSYPHKRLSWRQLVPVKSY